MKNTLFISALLSLFLFISCGSPADKLEDLDLMSEGIPLKLKAPADATVKQKDMGIFKDITVRSGEKFYIQITAGQVFNNDVKARITEELETVKALNSFSKIIKENDRGFIFEKKIGENISYDFRSIKIVGDTEYLFQSGLVGKFAQEDAELMFDAVE